MTLKEIDVVLKNYFDDFKLFRTCGCVMLTFEKDRIAVWFHTLEESEGKDHLTLRYNGQAVLSACIKK